MSEIFSDVKFYVEQNHTKKIPQMPGLAEIFLLRVKIFLFNRATGNRFRQSFCRADGNASSATHALRRIKFARRIQVKRTNFFAQAAVNAPVRREVESVKTPTIKQAVNRAERTHHAAKKSVDDDARDKHRNQHGEL